MPIVRKCLFLSLIAGNLAAAVAAEDTYTYVSAKYGKAFTKNISNSNLPIVSTVNILMMTPNDLGLKYKRGMSMSLAVGHKIGDFRVEAELSSMRSKYKAFTMNKGQNSLFTPLLSGHTKLMSGLVNVYYDLDLGSMIVPYAGMGTGVARVKNHIEFEQMVGKLQGTMTHRAIAYQGILGAALQLSKEFGVTVDYRYFATGKVKALEKRFQNNVVNLGLMVKF